MYFGMPFPSINRVMWRAQLYDMSKSSKKFPSMRARGTSWVCAVSNRGVSVRRST